MSTNQQTVELSISGMTCGSCLRHVTDALQNLEGVGDVRVDLAHGRASVGYHPAIASLDQMIASVQKAGYQAQLIRGSSAVSLPVRNGSSCGCCA